MAESNGNSRSRKKVGIYDRPKGKITSLTTKSKMVLALALAVLLLLVLFLLF